jgi:hypothetical protein
LAALLLPLAPAGAATFTVTNTNDAGAGSLRQAITDAGASPGADIVVIPAGLGTITASTTIQFGGADATTVQGNGNTVSYAAGTAFNSGGSTPYVLDGLVINADMGANTLHGALTITNSTLNVTSQGANTLDGPLVLADSTIDSDDDGLNTADGAITVDRSTITVGLGTGVNTRGTAISVTDSRIASADGDGINSSSGDITVTRSEVAAADEGVWTNGAIQLVSSSVIGTGVEPDYGVYSDAGVVSVVNSTVTGWQELGVTGESVSLVYSTVVANGSGEDEGEGENIVANDLSLFGSVVVGNPGSRDCVVVNGSATSAGWNYSDDDSCGLSGTGDTQNGGPTGLGALGANGGIGRTMVPQSGSPLLNAIPTANCQNDGAAGVTADERGVTRPSGTGCEIGAVEVTATPTTSTTPPPSSSTTSSSTTSTTAAPTGNSAVAVTTRPRYTG